MTKAHLYIIIISMCFSLNAFSQTLQDSLVLFYQFTGNLEDSTSNNYNATPAGAVFVNDKFGNPNSAIHFSGGNQAIDLPGIAELNYDSPKTFSTWVKVDSLPNRGNALFCSHYDTVGYYGYHIMLSPSIATGNGTLFNLDGRKTYTSTREVFANIWYHLVFVYHSIGNTDIYMYGQLTDGVYTGTADTMLFSDDEGKIGQVDNNYDSSPNPSFASLYGTIDDFMIWDRALSAQEVMQLYIEQQ